MRNASLWAETPKAGAERQVVYAGSMLCMRPRAARREMDTPGWKTQASGKDKPRLLSSLCGQSL